MITPSLRQLSFLIALEKEGSFSKAAESLYVTQSTLSAGIKELENLLGQQVVDRHFRKLRLTPLGQEILEDAKAILKRAEQITERARQISAPMSGPMRLGVIPTIAPYLLPRILPRIEKEFPKLEMQLYEDLSARLLEKLNRSDIDLAIMAFPFNTPGMSQHPLFDEPFMIACPANWACKRKYASIEDIDVKNLLLLEDGHCLRDHALDACHLQSSIQKKTYSTTSLPTLLEMVRHGYGITLLPSMAYDSLKQDKGIKLIPFQSPAPSRKIGIIWRSGHPREKEFKTLTGLIKP